MTNKKTAPEPTPEPIPIPDQFAPMIERLKSTAMDRDRLTAMLDADVALLQELMEAGGISVPDEYVLRNLDVGFEPSPRLTVEPAQDEEE